MFEPTRFACGNLILLLVQLWCVLASLKTTPRECVALGFHFALKKFHHKVSLFMGAEEAEEAQELL